MSDSSGDAAAGVPLRLGRYVVRRRVGAGGFATVWLAYDEQLDAPVAIKVLADNWAQDHHVRTRFVEEGRFLRRVESPHVVSVYDAGELDDGRPYLVMAYADQGTLADRLEVGPLTVPQALDVVRQVAAGLQALHDRDVLHRDVKPANVLFRSVTSAREGAGPRVMLGDLGLGKALDMSSRLSLVAGTPSYVSPEQAQGEAPDARADQYSLGVVTYLLLTGRTPHSHASLSSAADPGPPPPLSRAGLPVAAQDVVHRALARDREQRWPTVEEYAAQLAGAFAGWVPPAGAAEPAWAPLDPEQTRAAARPSPPPELPPEPPSPPPHGRSGPATGTRASGRSRLLAALVGVTVLVAAGAGGFWLQRGLDGDTTRSDASGSLTVTVPTGWTAAVADQGWTPPGEDATYDALSLGTERAWTDPGSAAQGVFLGVLPETGPFPAAPAHPECGTAGQPVETRHDGRPSVTVVHTDCPGGVLVERVVQVAGNRLLWVQVRSADRATANHVLDSVTTSGL